MKSSYSVKPADIFGRLGSGIGQGLAETMPKEIERGRLASGLQQFEQDASNLSPMQQLARISTIPGITPQMIQSFGDLARQQAKGNALLQANSQNQPQPKVGASFSGESLQQGKEIGKSPSITQALPIEKIQEGYIPPSLADKEAFAAYLFNQNPARFGYDPDKARQASDEHYMLQEKQNEAYLKKHGELTKLQDNVVNRLNNQADKLSVQIPPNTFSNIESKAINAVKPRSEGGEGLTEEQAMRKYGKELDNISRDYDSIRKITGAAIAQDPQGAARTIDSLQQKFAERGDSENFALKLEGDLNLSPMMAHSIAKPIKRDPAINSYIKNLPDLTPAQGAKLPVGLPGISSKIAPITARKTREISPKLAELMKKEDASPLSISRALKQKGYDPSAWLDYVTENRKELNLTEEQGRELDKPQPLITGLKDLWFSIWLGK